MHKPVPAPSVAQDLVIVEPSVDEGAARLPHGFSRVGEMSLGQILERIARPRFDEGDLASVRETLVLAATVWNISRGDPSGHVEALGQLVCALQDGGLPVDEAADLVFALYDDACAFPGDDRRVEQVQVTSADESGFFALVKPVPP